jgi:hypothetical protein
MISQRLTVEMISQRMTHAGIVGRRIVVKWAEI